MNYQIVGKNLKVTPAIEETIVKKVSRLERYFIHHENVKCYAVVNSVKGTDSIEITISTNLISIRAEISNDDLYAAIDLAIDKLEGQLRKFKTRMSRRNKKSLSENFNLEAIRDIPDESLDDQIVRRKSYEAIPMDLDEALTRMEALDHPFFVYRDSESGKISLLYKRVEEGFGLIELDEPNAAE